MNNHPCEVIDALLFEVQPPKLFLQPTYTVYKSLRFKNQTANVHVVKARPIYTQVDNIKLLQCACAFYEDVLKQLYLSLIIPHLEYGCHVWNPHPEKDKKALEDVQKFACRIATVRWDESYDTVFESHLQPLQERRTHARLRLMYRILHKLSYFPAGTFKLQNSTQPNSCSYQLELQVPFARTDSYFYSFVPHTSSLWNSLPKDIINLSTSYHSFKYHLRSQQS